MLLDERDPDGSYVEKFDSWHTSMMNACRHGTHEQNRCVLEAESLEEIKACP